MREAVIVSGARTAIGNFGGTLQDVPAAQLQATAIKGMLKKIGVRPGRSPQLDSFAPKDFQGSGEVDLEKKYNDYDKSLKEIYIDEVIIGNVLQAAQGQNPGRQACQEDGRKRQPGSNQAAEHRIAALKDRCDDSGVEDDDKPGQRHGAWHCAEIGGEQRVYGRHDEGEKRRGGEVNAQRRLQSPDAAADGHDGAARAPENEPQRHQGDPRH